MDNVLQFLELPGKNGEQYQFLFPLLLAHSNPDLTQIQEAIAFTNTIN
ncbi:hypothetical protein L2E67_15430 [Planktothrix agardhii 1803]|nr:hypothetical protein [Planktothrix agardhii]MCF3586465.1 hypothetical protein [Planktothrix agardhii 1803]